MVTKTRVAVSSVNIRLSAGEGSISGLSVGNPSGFSSPAVFQLGNISTKIDAASVTKDLIIIDHVTVSKPHIFYEINESGKSNINIIEQNIQKFQGEVPSGKTVSDHKDNGKNIKILIRKFVIDNGNVDVRIAALNKSMSASLPKIELSNLGGREGSSPGEVGAQILAVLTREAGSAASRLGVEKYLGKTLDEIRKGLLKENGNLKGAGEAVKKFFGQ